MKRPGIFVARAALNAGAEQAHVDQWVGEPPLRGGRRRWRRRCRRQLRPRLDRPSILGDALDAVDDRQHRHERLRGAQRSMRPALGIPVFRKEHRPRISSSAMMGTDQEHRAPPEVRQEHPRRSTDRWRRRRRSWRPRRRWRRFILASWGTCWRSATASTARASRRRGQQSAGDDQHLGAGREGGEQGGGAEGTAPMSSSCGGRRGRRAYPW